MRTSGTGVKRTRGRGDYIIQCSSFNPLTPSLSPCRRSLRPVDAVFDCAKYGGPQLVRLRHQLVPRKVTFVKRLPFQSPLADPSKGPHLHTETGAFASREKVSVSLLNSSRLQRKSSSVKLNPSRVPRCTCGSSLTFLFV